MKHFHAFAIALLLLPCMAMAQDSPEDRYIAIYDLIQQADAMADAANMREALPKYKEAQKALQKFQTDNPNWNTKIVKFRLNYLTGKINPLEDQGIGEIGKGAAVPAKPAVPVTVTTGTGAPDDQVKALRDQLRQAQAEKEDLERQLKSRPATAGPSAGEAQAMAEAQAKVRSLQQENDRLKSGLKQQGGAESEMVLMQRAAQALTDARAKLAEQSKLVTALSEQNTTLQKRLEAVTVDAAGSGQVATLQQQLREAEAERLSLQAQLKESRASGGDQLSKLEERIKNLQKENNLLRASLERRPTQGAVAPDSFSDEGKQDLTDLRKRLQDQSDQIAALTRDKETLQKRLDSVVNTDAMARELADTKQQLADTKVALKKLQRRYDILDQSAIVLITEYKMKIRQQGKAGENMMKQMEEAKILRDENESLREQLAEIRKSMARGDTSVTEGTADLIAAQNKLAALQARLDVLQAKPVPYTDEELKIFKVTEAPPASQQPLASKLPAGAADMVADAQRMFAAHRLEEAEAKYQQVLKMDPKNVFILANLATIQIERENFVDAEKNLRRAMSLQPKDSFTLGVYGNMLFRLAKYDEAFDALSQAAKLDPNSAEIQNVLGITLSHKGQRGAAETALRRALQLDPNYGNAHNNLAVIYITQEPPLTELARWHYQKALSLGVGRNSDLEKLIESSPVETPK